MRPLTRLTCCLWSWLLAMAATGVCAETGSGSIFARVWRSNDGLPSNEIAGMAQDASGYIWIAYRDGVTKFDGVNFRNVPLPFAPDSDYRIRSILRTSGDRFWLALDGGVIACVGHNQTNVFTGADGLPKTRPFTPCEARDGAIWVGYADGSACRIFGGRVARLTGRDGLAGVGNCRLASDNEGRIWFAQTGQVGLWKGDRFERMLSLPVQHVRIARARGDGVWICADSRLLRFKEGGAPEEFARLPLEHGLGTPEVLLEDRLGAVWVGTYGDGLFRCTSNKVESVETSQKTIFSLHEDREGNIWAGTAGGGLNRLRPRILRLHEVSSGLPFEAARSVCADGDGRIWAAARSGALGQWDGAKWRLCGTNDGWTGELATCVTRDRDNAVWIGTYRAGALYRWSNGKFQRWDRSTGLAGNTVSLLLADRTGKLWIGFNLPRAIQVLSDGKLQRVRGVPRGQTLCAATEDKEANVWFVTSEGSLLRAEGTLLVDETHRTANPARPVSRVQATPDGSLWIAYSSGALGRLRNGSFRLIDHEQGLPKTRICDMVPDTRGGLWLSTDAGILRVSQDALGGVADGTASQLNAIYYGSDELLSLQGLQGYSPGAAPGANGDILFPVLTGMAVVHSDRVSTSRHPPQVVIESILADGTSMDIPRTVEPLRLKPGLRKLEFEFTAPSFIAPTSIRFRHQLEGIDEGWADLGTQRRVTYTRLPPGKYTFRVTACDYAGLWNEVGDRVFFEIAPFFWQTLAFKLTLLGAAPILIIGLSRNASNRRLRREVRRLQQEAALNRERTRIAKDIHDDLGASLTQISLLGELANRDLQLGGRNSEHVEKLSRTARQAFGSLDEIVWAVNPSNDTLSNLLDYIAQFSLDFLSTTPIRCRIDFPSQPPELPISAEVRHAVYLIVREALNNVVKHARASEVHITAKLLPEQRLQLTIQDNGTGLASDAPPGPEADGLANIRHRVEELSGTLRMDSTPRSGTSIHIELSLLRTSTES